VIGALSLAGVAPLSGFLSKGMVLEAALQKHIFLYVGGVVASLLTAFCLFRAVFLVLSGERRPAQHPAAEAKESPQAMVLSLMVLAALAAAGGWVAMPASWGGGEWLQHFLTPIFPAGAGTGSMRGGPGRGLGVMREWIVTGVLLGSALLGISAAYFLYVARPKLPATIAAKVTGVQRFFFEGGHLDAVYNALFVQPLAHGAERLRRGADYAAVDGEAIGFSRLCLRLGEKARALHDGPASHWGLVTGGGILLLLIYVLLP
jgi:NADH-quinone oxidoreductase subunit L